jgi:hypothetical protein
MVYLWNPAMVHRRRVTVARARAFASSSWAKVSMPARRTENRDRDRERRQLVNWRRSRAGIAGQAAVPARASRSDSVGSVADGRGCGRGASWPPSLRLASGVRCRCGDGGLRVSPSRHDQPAPPGAAFRNRAADLRAGRDLFLIAGSSAVPASPAFSFLRARGKTSCRPGRPVCGSARGGAWPSDCREGNRIPGRHRGGRPPGQMTRRSIRRGTDQHHRHRRLG